MRLSRRLLLDAAFALATLAFAADDFTGTVSAAVFFPDAVFPAALAVTPLTIAFRTSGGTFAGFTPVFRVFTFPFFGGSSTVAAAAVADFFEGRFFFTGFEESPPLCVQFDPEDGAKIL